MQKIGVLSTVTCACIACAAFLAAPIGVAKAENVKFTISDAPTVRLEGTGLRFSLSVDNEYHQQLITQGEYAGYTATVGVALLPTEFLEEGELTATDTYGEHAPIVAPLTNIDVANSTDTQTSYNVVVTDIPYAAYEQELSARGFIKLVKSGETDGYIYTDGTVSAAIAEVATAAYSAEENAEEKSKLGALLEGAISETTTSFDKAEYEMNPPNVRMPFCLLGNKFGFTPSAEWLEENVVFTTDDEGIAKVDGENILGQGEGETQLTAKVGDKVIATATVKVGDFTITDETGKFSWEYDGVASVVKGDKQYVNTGIVNGTPQNPLTLNGYEVVTNGKYTQVNGTFKLSTGVQIMEFVANVVNEKGDPDNGATTTIIDETFKVRLTDVKNPEKTLDLEYITPNFATTAFYFGFTYSNGDVLLNLGVDDASVVYGYGFGNSSHALANVPKLIYHGNYQFGFGSGARDLFDKATGKKLATQLSEDSFGTEGVFVSVNSGKKGMMITNLAEPTVPSTPDETGKFSYQHSGANAVTKTTKDGVVGYEITATRAAVVTYNQPIELNNAEQDIFSFLTSSPSTTTMVVLRFTDYYDSSKGVALAIMNTVSNDIGWGATGATYVRSGNVNDVFTDDFGYWTPISNDDVRLGSSTGKMILRFNGNAEQKFSVLLPDATPTYYGLKHTGDASLFSAENTTCKVNVSIEFISNNQPATLFVSNIGGAFAE